MAKVRRIQDEPLENMLRRFRDACRKEQTFSQLVQRMSHASSSERRRAKDGKATRRAKFRLQKKAG